MINVSGGFHDACVRRDILELAALLLYIIIIIIIIITIIIFLQNAEALMKMIASLQSRDRAIELVWSAASPAASGRALPVAINRAGNEY